MKNKISMYSTEQNGLQGLACNNTYGFFQFDHGLQGLACNNTYGFFQFDQITMNSTPTIT